MTAITKLSDRLAISRLDDEIIVMRLDTGETLSLTQTAAAIWRLIDGTRDRDALVAAVADEYSAGHQAVAADVDAFLAQLRDAGLIAAD